MERNKWQPVIVQGIRIGVISGMQAESALPVVSPKTKENPKGMDHKEAVLKLHLAGHHPPEISDLMRRAGFFKNKSRPAVHTLVRATITYAQRRQAQPDRKPPRSQAETSRVDQMLALSAKLQRR